MGRSGSLAPGGVFVTVQSTTSESLENLTFLKELAEAGIYNAPNPYGAEPTPITKALIDDGEQRVELRLPPGHGPSRTGELEEVRARRRLHDLRLFTGVDGDVIENGVVIVDGQHVPVGPSSSAEPRPVAPNSSSERQSSGPHRPRRLGPKA